MSKILVIGLGSAGRNVCRILKDDGLDAKFVTFGGFKLDRRDDIPHHNIFKMNGYSCGFPPCRNFFVFRQLAENKRDEITQILKELL